MFCGTPQVNPRSCSSIQSIEGIILPPAFYGGYCRVKKTRKAAVACKVFPDEDAVFFLSCCGCERDPQLS